LSVVSIWLEDLKLDLFGGGMHVRACVDEAHKSGFVIRRM